MNDIKNILLVGVGGQGVLTASEILSEALMLEGFDVKKAEVHGMSQRGGSVNSHLRYGPKVYSPLIEEGKADIIFSFELVEALRYSNYLKEEGFIVCSNEKIIPNSVYFSQVKYPKDPAGALKTAFGKKFYLIDAVKIAGELGNVRFANVVLLGTVSHLMKISDISMKKAIESMVPPKYVTENLNAFEKGKELAK